MKRLFEVPREMMHMRVFDLKGSQYVLTGTDLTMEDYLVNELETGYMLSDIISYSIDQIRISTSYAPAAVEKYIKERTGLADEQIKDTV